MAESDEDVYEDAPEAVVREELTLDQSIEDACKFLDLFFVNKYAKALTLIRPWADTNMYYALGQGSIYFMQAALTLEASDIELAMESLKRGAELSNRKRRRTSIKNKILRTPDYNLYTQEEVHAELCYAEHLLLIALLTFVEDQSLVSFVKGGLRIRSCYQAYKECVLILENRDWPSSRDRIHFESGVKMGVGAFNLMMSQLPTRVLKLLEFIGFSGNRVLGLSELEEGAAIRGSLRAPLCALILLAYHTLVTYVLGNGDGDLVLSERILKDLMARYPTGSFFIFFSARVHQLKGQVDKAIEIYQESIKAQEEWKQFHYMCYWELLWCYSYKADWQAASKYSGILQRECRWSPAVYTYVHASILHMLRVQGQGGPHLQEEIDSLMRKVPSLKQRLAGKSIPLEKFVVRKSQKYFTQNNQLLLPALELQYVWNSYVILSNAPDHVANLLTIVQKHLPEMDEEEDGSEVADDYCLGLLLAGMCLKCLKRPLEAQDRFREILKLEKRVRDDLYILPYAMTELALLALDAGNVAEAKDWLETARHNYRGYPMETMLHFRVHSILSKLKMKQRSSAS